MSVQGALLGGAASGSTMGSAAAGFGSGLGAGVGLGAAFSQLNQNQGYNTYRSHQRKLWTQQRSHQNKWNRLDRREQLKRLQQFPLAMRQGAEAAGFHPLAALGMSTGNATAPITSNPPMMPGQSGTGSAVSDGVQSYLAYKSAMLGLQNQKLQNDLAKEQLHASKIARISQAANASQDILKAGQEVKLTRLLNEKGKTPRQVAIARRYEHTRPGQTYNLFGHIPIDQRAGKVTPEAVESAAGEPGGWLYSPFSILQDIGYTLDKMYRDPETGRVTKGTDPWKVDPFGYDYDY